MALSDGYTFSDSSRNVFLANPSCSGGEISIGECLVNGLPCSQAGVGVVCQGMCV